MGWLGGASDTQTNSSSNQSQYGTHTPLLSPQYSSIFNAYANTLGFDPSQWSGTNYGSASAPYSQASTFASSANTPAPTSAVQQIDPVTGQSIPYGTPGYTGPNPQQVTGYNPSQTTAVNWMANDLSGNPVGAATTNINSDMNLQKGYLDSIIGGDQKIGTQAAPQATLAAPAVAGQSSGTSIINPAQASQYINNYLSPYLNSAVAATNNIQNYNTGVGLNALNASRGAGSAFGDRANLSNGSYLAASNLGNAQTIANMENLGFTNALSPSMADASNNLSAQTSNANNTLTNNMFNAGQQTGVSEFNTGQANQNAQFNVGAQQTNTAQNLAGNAAAAAAISQKTGIDQSLLNNVVTANGINTQAAQNLFNAGTISQAQLNALLDAASGTNGFQFDQNTNGTSNSNVAKVTIGSP